MKINLKKFKKDFLYSFSDNTIQIKILGYLKEWTMLTSATVATSTSRTSTMTSCGFHSIEKPNQRILFWNIIFIELFHKHDQESKAVFKWTKWSIFHFFVWKLHSVLTYYFTSVSSLLNMVEPQEELCWVVKKSSSGTQTHAHTHAHTHTHTRTHTRAHTHAHTHTHFLLFLLSCPVECDDAAISWQFKDQTLKMKQDRDWNN